MNHFEVEKKNFSREIFLRIHDVNERFLWCHSGKKKSSWIIFQHEAMIWVRTKLLTLNLMNFYFRNFFRKILSCSQRKKILKKSFEKKKEIISHLKIVKVKFFIFSEQNQGVWKNKEIDYFCYFIKKLLVNYLLWNPLKKFF